MNDAVTAIPSIYPASLEEASLDFACRATGYKKRIRAMRELEKDLVRLGDCLTVSRDQGLSPYAQDRRALAAYQLFYGPQTYVRVATVLREWRERIRPDLPEGRPLRVLDAGAGTGAATFALFDILGASGIRVTAIDRSREALRILRELAGSGFDDGRDRHIRTRELELPHIRRVTEQPWDLIIASFSLNEIVEERAEDYLYDWTKLAAKCLAPGGWLIIVEPATSGASWRMQRHRDRLAAEGPLHIHAPCLHEKPCPMLKDAPDAWCHEVRRWRAPESLRLMNRSLRRDIRHLRFSFLIASPLPAPAYESAERLVSPLASRKGLRCCTGCSTDGRLHNTEVLERNVDDDAKETIKQIERGDIVSWDNRELLGDNQTERADAIPRILYRPGG